MTHIRFTPLKRTLKITGATDEPIKLSMNMWQALDQAHPYIDKRGVGTEIWEELCIARWTRDGVKAGLELRHLITSTSYKYKLTDEDSLAHVGKAQTVYVSNLLTKRANMLRRHPDWPACPAEKDWPALGASSLSSAQKAALAGWTTRTQLCIPIGSDRRESSRWAHADRNQSTLNALLRMELIEIGIRGIDLVDGKVTKTGTPELVYRLTILGGLLSGA